MIKSNLFRFSIALISVFYFRGANAQLQLPAPSPKASVMQTAGLTEITIEYSSPGMKGRVIWGELVPYDKIWRAGANSATKITFSKDVTIEGINVPKGSYSFFIIPAKADWTLILNKDAAASTDEYKQENDMVRIKALPMPIPQREHLTYSISEFSNEMAIISTDWENIRLSFRVNLATAKQAAENIEKTLGSTWQLYNSSARYYFDQKDYDKAMGYVNQSLAMSEQWYNHWVKAQILFAKGMNKEAYEHAAKAKEMGDLNSKGFFFKDQVEKALNDWKAFAPPAKMK